MKKVGTAAIYLYLGIVFIITIFPLIWVLMQSFKPTKEIVSSPLSLPKNLYLTGYADAMRLAPITTFYANSIIIAIASMILTVLLYSMCAYVLSKKRSILTIVLVSLFSLSMYVPRSALMQPIFRIVLDLGMYDRRSGLVLVYTAFNMPVTLFLLRSQFLSVPAAIEESAYIDGASIPKTLFLIMIPIIKPGLATAAILSFINSWNEFLFALILTSSEKTRTLPLALNYFTSQFNYNYSALFAALVIVMFPNILVFILMQERVIGGMTAGAVKG